MLMVNLTRALTRNLKLESLRIQDFLEAAVENTSTAFQYFLVASLTDVLSIYHVPMSTGRRSTSSCSSLGVGTGADVGMTVD